MYKALPSFVLGFHGCDKEVVDNIINSNNKYLEPSENDYDRLAMLYKERGLILPENKPLGQERALLKRRLDCAVIETTHKFYRDEGKAPFDSVRGVFWEGKDLYENAGFKEKNHIQICVRKHNCIKGFFHPREKR